MQITLSELASYAAISTLVIGVPEATTVSKQADGLNSTREYIYSCFENTHSFFQEHDQAVCELEELCEEALVENWDGYGGRPANSLAVAQAKKVLRHLPLSIPVPSVSILPNDAVQLEWHQGVGRRFVVNIHEDRNRFGYAWISGKRRGSAVGTYENGEIPEYVLRSILTI